jgi:hypothetical protein
MSVYSPSGSGNVHVDKAISGGRRQPVAAKKALPPFMAKKAAPVKKAAAKKMPGKAMSDGQPNVAKPAPRKGKAGGAQMTDPTKPAKAGSSGLCMTAPEGQPKVAKAPRAKSAIIPAKSKMPSRRGMTEVRNGAQPGVIGIPMGKGQGGGKR